MKNYRYLHLDVFTDQWFEGNQLAVFPDARGLSVGVMQRIAAEMAFSETTFILPPERGGDVRMRIFTPGEELPMAGHPTIGSTFALAHEGVIAGGRREFVFELGVGPTTAGCSRRRSVSGRIRPPEARAGRSAATSSTTASCRRMTGE